MSIFDISRAGLAVQAEAIQVTSNNVSNASTVGYKARESLFVDQYFKAVQSAGTSGTSDFGTKRVDEQGALQASSSTLDLAIQGQGMFRMASLPAGDEVSYYYSRNGLFSADKNGYIVNANGLFLTGYQPNADLTGVTGALGGLKLPPTSVAPVASSEGRVDANLDVRLAMPVRVVGGVATDVPKTFAADDASTFSASTTVTAYDTKGLTHQVTVFLKKVAPTVLNDPRSLSTPPALATANQYEVYMMADGVLLTRAPAGTVGTGMLGAAAETAAAQARAVANASATATANAEAKAGNYRAAVADEAGAAATRDAALTVLAAVAPSAALSAASPAAAALVTAASALATANADLAVATGRKGLLETARAAADAALAGESPLNAVRYDELTAAAASAAAALSDYELGGYAVALGSQATRFTAFQSALQASPTLASAATALTTANALVAQRTALEATGVASAAALALDPTNVDLIAADAVAVAALTDFDTANPQLVANQAQAQLTRDAVIARSLNTASASAHAAIEAYGVADSAVLAGSVATAAALLAKQDADTAATSADLAHKLSVAANRIGTLQFVDGQLVGSLTRNSVTGDPALPAVFHAEMADSSGNPLFDLELDLSDITAYATAFQVREATADGYAPGALTGVSVDEMGVITGQYTNGKSLVGGQLVLATFNSEAGLQAVAQSVFTESFTSGEPVLGTGTAGSFGAIRSAMLEQSNIDMAGELVKLMIQQRNYQANSQGIRAADTVLTTAINLSR
ncbi:MAG: flagellar hook-basal body complex protein [Hydrogenophaga sp.]|uniref:flagellar hook-basal body complex protein n=1 Tax=Hydrogenophaga sp. TaxID=1904254 RepID=UPI0026178CE8|nr:flagellar hook-basal body complex protein [Hydrogenophaga sp.]MDM7942425.1 flagellar hook-basal body complex protein [Hydrogenophaga sp.]